MRYAVINNYDPLFKQFLLVSLALHVGFVLFVTLRSLLFSSATIEIPQSVRVDLVGLPNKIKDPTPAPPVPVPQTQPEVAKPVEPVAKPKPTVVPPEKINLKDAQKKALDKLRAQEALKKLKDEVANQKKSTENPAPPPPQQFRGNIISSGSSFTGLSRLRVNEYLAYLFGRIQQNWSIPQWLNETELKASVIISIDDRGYVVRKEIRTSSGNSVFDSSCLSAIADASPFDPPPNEVREALLLVNFPFE